MSSNLSANLTALQGLREQDPRSARADGDVSAKDEDGLRKAAHAFETLMLQQVFSEMRRANANFGTKDMGQDFYEGMLDSAVAESSAKQGGIGLADILLRSWGVEDAQPEPVEHLFDPAAVDADLLDQAQSWRAPVSGAATVVSTHEERGSGNIVFQAEEDLQVHAVAPGRVSERDDQQVTIDHPSGWATRYRVEGPSNVEVGDWVNPALPLAMGSSGSTVHFEYGPGRGVFDVSQWASQYKK